MAPGQPQRHAVHPGPRAAIVGLDAGGAGFTVEVAGGDAVPVRVPFGSPVGDRTEVRVEILRLAMEACAASAAAAPDHD